MDRAEVLSAVAALSLRYLDLVSINVGLVEAAGADPATIRLDLADGLSFAALRARAEEALRGSQGVTTADDPRITVLFGAAVPAPDAPWLRVVEHGEELELTAGGELPGPGTERLPAHVRVLLEAARAEPDKPVDRLPILTADELATLLVDWNATRADYPRACVHELFAAQAERTPQAIAVQSGEQSLTYGELDCRANQLAHRLVALGLGPGVLAGICLERSAAMLVGLLAIMKAGGAYVPIDPTYPIERQEFMLTNSQAPVVLTQESLLGSLPLEDVEVVCLDRDWPSVAELPSHPPAVTADPEQLAYVIYTSGSTGQPKGVQIPHRALVNFLVTMGERPGLRADDVLVAVTTLSFDIAGLELYLPLLTGARVVVAPTQTVSDPRALGDLLVGCGATIMQATPTTWRMLLDSDWRAPAGMRALCGGEPLPVALADRLVESGLELWNMYGPTETTIWSTCTRVETVGESLTIGRPIGNTTLYVLDHGLQPVPVGVAGELWIGGDGLARGYRGRDDLTAERFIADPFDPREGARIYRTGDLVRYRRSGEVEFLSRIDNQVKVRGFRIELGEIETVLARHPGIAEAVVVARPGEDGGEAELAAYVIPTAEPVAGHALRAHAATSLPAYMVPLTVTTLEAFPLTPNGKVDRNALPAPSRQRSSERELVGPRTDLERQLVAIWEEQLGIHPIGVRDNFFDLGVSSITAATLFATIEHELGGRLPLGAIFRAPTVEQLAALIAEDAPGSRWTSLVPIQPGGSLPPIFCIHGGAGTILHLQALARRLGEDQPFYGLQSRGLYGGAAPLRTVEEMASHYLSEMRQVHPEGQPWRLAGYCFGTIVAFELAQRLLAAGEQIELVAMFNGPSPTWIKRWGWYGNQPSWRAKAGVAPLTEAEQRYEYRQRVRRRRVLMRLTRRAKRALLTVPRALRDPRRLLTGLLWYTRGPRTRVLLALGRPVPEQLREAFFFDLHADAERAYTPRPYDGELVVFYGSGLYEDPSLGWDGLAARVQTLEVPGEHTGNRQAMKEPAVGFVSARLREYLSARG